MLKPDLPLSGSLPRDLPWRKNVALLLDGVSVEKLPQKLYTWSDSPDFEPLYLGTRWSALNDISPTLIRLSGQNDPVFQQFLAHADKEWGYLVFSDQPWSNMLDHFRWLTSVTHPQGAEVLLRLADPAVAHALLDQAKHLNDATLWGPCLQIVTADAALGCWHQHHRPANAPVTSHAKPYRLNDSQITLLDEVNFRSVVMRLDQHLYEYFPAFQTELQTLERWKYLNELASQSYERGFCSEFEITLYANIHGFLGKMALAEHPDLDDLLASTSEQTPVQRLEYVANIAKERAESLQRNPG
ncbi:DUF4123 domain-containing protein [Pseudomonas cichorii]|uniref:DUF4123 domain-containing protein n=1 Tax=Pseudomonas cichorii TaxID=36746 RepID=UPI001C89C482|nr:DUF4123 domain-containing protein [Pseudomonas cichorii]MBX8531232.1 DUF4123 domain-containing protein [Pseudomonas cichorii]